VADALKTGFDWLQATSLLKGFGGEPITLHIPKTGLPYFDALRLYGAIDLYVGLREDISIHDAGKEWRVEGRSRAHRLAERDERAFAEAWKNKKTDSRGSPKIKKPNPREYCHGLRAIALDGELFHDSILAHAKGDWDAALQDGLRGVAAREYDTLQSGQTTRTECKAAVPLSQALHAFAGMKRTEGVGDITFLPVFEGRVDFSKVVCPVRTWLRPPHILCSQALMLLALQTSLFAEGYPRTLRGVVFNTKFNPRKHTNCSGLVTIDSTAIGQIRSSCFAGHVYKIFLTMVQEAWDATGRTKKFYPHALAMTYWLMEPISKHLSSMITSQEVLRRENSVHMFTDHQCVKEVFVMTYKNWNGDYDAVRTFAKAVASGIKWARGRDSMGNWLPPDEQRKNWYDEITLLRSAPTFKAFRERALILIEQGHREHSEVGTGHRGEAFDPQALLASVGGDRGPVFESFRDLFRMYLVQASTDDSKAATVADAARAVTDQPEGETGHEEGNI
jgi:hypothetical protein